MPEFEISHFYPNVDPQLFWDFLVDHQWQSKSSIMPGEVTIDKPGDGHPQGLGAVRRITIGNIDLTEDVVGFEPPRYIGYQVHEGGSGMPVRGYRGEMFLEAQVDGLVFRYRGTFETRLWGTGWLFKRLFRWRINKMIPIWAQGYEAYRREGKAQ